MDSMIELLQRFLKVALSRGLVKQHNGHFVVPRPWSIAEAVTPALWNDINDLIKRLEIQGSLSETQMHAVAGFQLSERQIVALLLLIFETGYLREYAAEGTAIPYLKEAYSPILADRLFFSDPALGIFDLHKQLIQSAVSIPGINLRNALDDTMGQRWYRTLFVQFGFTRSAIKTQLRDWLTGGVPPIAIEMLLGEKLQNTFRSLWTAMKAYVRDEIEQAPFIQSLKGSPWIPDTWIDEIVTALDPGMTPFKRVTGIRVEDHTDSGYPEEIGLCVVADYHGSTPIKLRFLPEFRNPGAECDDFMFWVNDRPIAKLERDDEVVATLTGEPIDVSVEETGLRFDVALTDENQVETYRETVQLVSPSGIGAFSASKSAGTFRLVQGLPAQDLFKENKEVLFVIDSQEGIEIDPEPQPLLRYRDTVGEWVWYHLNPALGAVNVLKDGVPLFSQAHTLTAKAPDVPALELFVLGVDAAAMTVQMKIELQSIGGAAPGHGIKLRKLSPAAGGSIPDAWITNDSNRQWKVRFETEDLWHRVLLDGMHAHITVGNRRFIRKIRPADLLKSIHTFVRAPAAADPVLLEAGTPQVSTGFLAAPHRLAVRGHTMQADTLLFAGSTYLGSITPKNQGAHTVPIDFSLDPRRLSSLGGALQFQDTFLSQTSVVLAESVFESGWFSQVNKAADDWEIVFNRPMFANSKDLSLMKVTIAGEQARVPFLPVVAGSSGVAADAIRGLRVEVSADPAKVAGYILNFERRVVGQWWFSAVDLANLGAAEGWEIMAYFKAPILHHDWRSDVIEFFFRNIDEIGKRIIAEEERRISRAIDQLLLSCFTERPNFSPADDPVIIGISRMFEHDNPVVTLLGVADYFPFMTIAVYRALNSTRDGQTMKMCKEEVISTLKTDIDWYTAEAGFDQRFGDLTNILDGANGISNSPKGTNTTNFAKLFEFDDRFRRQYVINRLSAST